jgi:hypothetical protein
MFVTSLKIFKHTESTNLNSDLHVGYSFTTCRYKYKVCSLCGQWSKRNQLSNSNLGKHFLSFVFVDNCFELDATRYLLSFLWTTLCCRTKRHHRCGGNLKAVADSGESPSPHTKSKARQKSEDQISAHTKESICLENVPCPKKMKVLLH